MDRKKLFDDFFARCKKEPKQFCGQGEKNSSILIIGKESTNVTVDANHQTCEKEKGCGCFPRDRGKPYETWSKYQKLIETVYSDEYLKKPCNKRFVDFERFAFTTELSNNPLPQSSFVDAKPSIEERLYLFRSSDFIQSFPVIILACGGYIRNQGIGSERQIDNTFGVKYDGDENGKHEKSKANWYFTHHNEDRTKLVIHTRQFSQNIMNELIDAIALEIRQFLNIK